MKTAILGYGVVGQGTARLIIDRQKELTSLTGDATEIAYILDLRDFPDSPLADRVVHSIDPILADSAVSTVIETMGGSHPAYEYTMAALRAGKNVITSNKEVVANFGDEFLRVAKEHCVSYRFEAAVGGGIPIITPLISLLRHNRIREVRGILNGTTNYILTKMFTLGDSFASALADAQARGYAERNPDADILGTDACRKITILAALVTGKLFPTDRIHTEGITKIRPADVRAAEKAGCHIRLVARARLTEKNEVEAVVAPFLVPDEEPLSHVAGVYNAVEVVAEPLGNVMFYGQGAGAGATASAVVADLVTIATTGTRGILPTFIKSDDIADFGSFTCGHYLALPAAQADRARAVLGGQEISVAGNEYAVLTSPMRESDLEEKIRTADLTPLSHIRLL